MAKIEFNEDGSHIIKTIQDSVRTEKINVQPGDYTTRAVSRVPRLTLAGRLGVTTLTGVLDYLNNGLDEEARPNVFITVDSPTSVTITDQISKNDDDRFEPLVAAADTPNLIFDKFISRQEAMIMLQARFVPTDARKVLLAALGNIVADEELQQEDDGVGQRVTTQKGINRSEEKIVNPVLLRPFRTFTEIEQPESPFIVRLHQSDDDIKVAIFEADGGAWRNTARQSIKAFLEAGLNEDSKVPVIA